MVEYKIIKFKTKNNKYYTFYYKIYKNKKIKRITREEYLKKIELKKKRDKYKKFNREPPITNKKDKSKKDKSKKDKSKNKEK